MSCGFLGLPVPESTLPTPSARANLAPFIVEFTPVLHKGPGTKTPTKDKRSPTAVSPEVVQANEARRRNKSIKEYETLYELISERYRGKQIRADTFDEGAQTDVAIPSSLVEVHFLVIREDAFGPQQPPLPFCFPNLPINVAHRLSDLRLSLNRRNRSRSTLSHTASMREESMTMGTSSPTTALGSMRFDMPELESTPSSPMPVGAFPAVAGSPKVKKRTFGVQAEQNEIWEEMGVAKRVIHINDSDDEAATPENQRVAEVLSMVPPSDSTDKFDDLSDDEKQKERERRGSYHIGGLWKMAAVLKKKARQVHANKVSDKELKFEQFVTEAKEELEKKVKPAVAATSNRAPWWQKSRSETSRPQTAPSQSASGSSTSKGIDDWINSLQGIDQTDDPVRATTPTSVGSSRMQKTSHKSSVRFSDNSSVDDGSAGIPSLPTSGSVGPPAKPPRQGVPPLHPNTHPRPPDTRTAKKGGVESPSMPEEKEEDDYDLLSNKAMYQGMSTQSISDMLINNPVHEEYLKTAVERVEARSEWSLGTELSEAYKKQSSESQSDVSDVEVVATAALTEVKEAVPIGSPKTGPMKKVPSSSTMEQKRSWKKNMEPKARTKIDKSAKKLKIQEPDKKGGPEFTSPKLTPGIVSFWGKAGPEGRVLNRNVMNTPSVAKPESPLTARGSPKYFSGSFGDASPPARFDGAKQKGVDAPAFRIQFSLTP